ncbi:hypothetical protein ACFOEE_19855 [Pseudoalteromonas fenneropenaei]|uniref:Orphan protein n=1 Tax=Pseudoalteromonas fenneropenaei TaxID=1737459 RepID=A0ABV7CQ62_9GAMM
MSEQLTLTIQLRLEPGCMGPNGKQYIEAFCTQQNQQAWQNSFAVLHVIPRYDKTLPEWEYFLKSKRLNDSQVEAVLTVFNQERQGLEETIEHQIADAVDAFMRDKY